MVVCTVHIVLLQLQVLLLHDLYPDFLLDFFPFTSDITHAIYKAQLWDRGSTKRQEVNPGDHRIALNHLNDCSV